MQQQRQPDENQHQGQPNSEAGHQQNEASAVDPVVATSNQEPQQQLPQWKRELIARALREEIIKNPQPWIDRLDEPMPVWAVLELFMQLLDRLDPHYQTLD